MKNLTVSEALIKLNNGAGNKKILETLSKYAAPEQLLKKCGDIVFHATFINNLENIKENGLTDFWFGIDMDECIEFAMYNHENSNLEDVIVLEISTKDLDASKCDFTVDTGDGYSNAWAGTGLYKGTIQITQIKHIWE